jgi:hypothetical protein
MRINPPDNIHFLFRDQHQYAQYRPVHHRNKSSTLLPVALNFLSEFLVCISCSFFPYKYTTPWVIVCFRLKKKKWMGRPHHLRLSPAVFPSSSPPLLDLLHMKQHCVIDCCLKLLPKSRAVTHQPSWDFTRCAICSSSYHVFENWRKRGKQMSFYCGWRNEVCAILFQSVLKIVSWVSALSSGILSPLPHSNKLLYLVTVTATARPGFI